MNSVFNDSDNSLVVQHWRDFLQRLCHIESYVRYFVLGQFKQDWHETFLSHGCAAWSCKDVDAKQTRQSMQIVGVDGERLNARQQMSACPITAKLVRQCGQDVCSGFANGEH